jgi:hypothetical protein
LSLACISPQVGSPAEEDRTAFLKGIMVGVAIRKVADAFEEPEWIINCKQTGRAEMKV